MITNYHYLSKCKKHFKDKIMTRNKGVSADFLSKLSKLQQKVEEKGTVKLVFSKVLSMEEMLITELAGYTHFIRTINTKDYSVVHKTKS